MVARIVIGTAILLLVGVYFLSTADLPVGQVATPSPAEAIGSRETPQGESLFAEIDENGNVLRVIVADEKVINSGLFGDPANWVRTYADGRERGKYAGKGDVYGKDLDAFATSTEALEHMKRL